jgi:hypothetical protein
MHTLILFGSFGLDLYHDLCKHCCRYTHKTSSYWTSSYKMSSYKTSMYQTFSYKTSRLQNVLITKRPFYQTSRLPNVQLPNVQLQNVHTSNYYKTSSFFHFSNTDNYDGFSPLKKYELYLTLTYLYLDLKRIINYNIHMKVKVANSLFKFL